MLTMISPDRALDLVRANATLRPVVVTRPEDAGGMTLSMSVCADRDFPPFSRAMMDGFAARVEDAGRVVDLVGEVAAGQQPQQEVREGACVNVMTGAPCPEGTEVVVPVEQASLDDGKVKLPESLTPGKHIAPRGCDCPADSEVLEVGQPVTPLTAAILAAVGREQVRVHRKPSVAVISTGNELCAGGSSPEDHQIRDSNGPMLAAQARQAGLLPGLVCRAVDTMESLGLALEAASCSDLVLLSGGVSMGQHDLVPAALQEHGVAMIFHKVMQKPGKPMLFGRKGDRLYFGLPGNPLASHLCFERYVLPAARKMAGIPARPVIHSGALMRPLSVSASRTLFLLGCGRFREHGLDVQPLVGSGSADLFFKQLANGYIRVEPGERVLGAGDHVDFQFHGGCV